jgi:hypothetical protein
MQTICAWCSREMKDDGQPDGLVSHGICPNCAARVEADLQERRDFPGLEEPCGPICSSPRF